jgi:hypothetical protein
VDEAFKRISKSSKPLNEQISATYNILQDFEGKYASDVAIVGLGRWVSELKARNTAFAGLMRERVDEGSLNVDIMLKRRGLGGL